MIKPPKEWKHILYKSDILYTHKISEFILNNDYIKYHDCYIPYDLFT